MPIEIRELVIKVTVTPDSHPAVVIPGEVSFDLVKKQIVRDCVEQVIIKLNKRKQR